MWVHKRVLDVDPSRPKAPVYITKGNAVFSNKQTRKHLLCGVCEQRFSTNEDYVARLTSPEGLQTKLFNKLPRLGSGERVTACMEDDEDGDQLSYFAASLMWRCSVMTGECQLGPYEEEFRLYLLDAAPFPRHAVLAAEVFENTQETDVRGWASEPTSKKVGIGWLHGFMLGGIGFRCWVGKAVPSQMRKISIAERGQKRYVSIVKPEGSYDFLAAAEMAIKAKV
jgi:hypothetical protein